MAHHGNILDAARPKPNYAKRAFALGLAILAIALAIGVFRHANSTDSAIAGQPTLTVGRYSVEYVGRGQLDLPKGAAYDVALIINHPRVTAVKWCDFLPGGLVQAHQWDREHGFTERTLVFPPK